MMLIRATLTITLFLGVVAAPVAIEAEQATKAYRIGYLSASSASSLSSRTEAFLQGLRELGYNEGNATVESRFSDGNLDRLRTSAMELVRLKVNVIVTAGPLATRIARDVTPTVPIVMASDSDPVGMGIVASLARPGGNTTGLTSLTRELVGKRLELLRELIPRLARVAIMCNPTEPGVQLSIRDTQSAARVLGMQAQLLEQRAPSDLRPAFDAAKRGRTDALIVLQDPVTSSNRALVVKLADEYQIPAIYWTKAFVAAGGLLSYAANDEDLSRRAAGFVDRILKGAKPADLPVEQPTKFELAINRKTAKALGLTIPPSLLLQADHIIE